MQIKIFILASISLGTFPKEQITPALKNRLQSSLFRSKLCKTFLAGHIVRFICKLIKRGFFVNKNLMAENKSNIRAEKSDGHYMAFLFLQPVKQVASASDAKAAFGPFGRIEHRYVFRAFKQNFRSAINPHKGAAPFSARGAMTHARVYGNVFYRKENRSAQTATFCSGCT